MLSERRPLIKEFQSFDMNLTEEDPDIVVLGFDTTLTYEKNGKSMSCDPPWMPLFLELIQTGTVR